MQPTRLLSVLFLAVLLAFAPACTTTTKGTAAKTLATTAQTVDAAMQGWAAWVVLGKATPQAEAQVRQAYARYQLAMGAARNAYLTLDATGDKDAWAQASILVSSARADLLNLVNEFTKEKP